LSGPAFSAVIPVYNDRAALGRAIPVSIRYLSAISPDFELIVAEDGSSDGSADLVRDYAETDPRVRLLHSDERLGRGKALNRAFKEARAPVVCYYDVDLATGMEYLGELIGAIHEGYDIATGSRLLRQSRIHRTGGREIASRGYNFLVRTILGSRLYDHQCGFKSFRRDQVIKLSGRVRATHWFWDTEILVRAQRAGYRIKEFPVRWEQGPGTTVQKSDVVGMGFSVLRLWWQIYVQET
jgi:glycosyltransferase AglD